MNCIYIPPPLHSPFKLLCVLEYCLEEVLKLVGHTSQWSYGLPKCFVNTLDEDEELN